MVQNVKLILTLIFVLIALLSQPASAIYNWEGIPVEPRLLGEIQGEVLTFGTYGLEAPPIDLSFTLPEKPVFGRVYVGIWGGTQHYTGWAEINVNNLQKARFQLEGERDRNREVYVSSHGSYWLAYDATKLLRSGENLISVTTSRGEPGNRLDGRVYGVVVVAGVKDPTKRTQYWIAEGNENLHGEGWAGINPTRKDSSTTVFEYADLTDLISADFRVVMTATNAGQPDYILFNDHDLGVELPDGTRNIGNERSFSATGGPGIPSRYIDKEQFCVTGYLQETNIITFERGRDLDGDGQIKTSGSFVEGNDYLHPVLAILTIEKKPGPVSLDLAVAGIRTQNAYAGETAKVIADIRNYGGLLEDPVMVRFSAGGDVFAEEHVHIGYDGMADVSVFWIPPEGMVTIQAEVIAPGDKNPANNVAERTITVGTPPDIAVSIGQPRRSGEGMAAPSPEESPAALPIVFIGTISAFFLLRRMPPRTISAVLAGMLIIGCIGGSIPLVTAEGFVAYDLPVRITNNGGSDAPPFDVVVYLDGERAAVLTLEDGVSAHSSLDILVPIYTTPGRHVVRVVADEQRTLKERNVADNTMERAYVFP